MAIQPIPNGLLPLDSCAIWGTGSGGNNIMDAAGEGVAFIGRIYIEGAPASNTISSAGGAITFRTGSVTFANAGTNVRIGIQDLTAGGVNDDTFDVYADFTGGGGGLASFTWYEKAMTTGSKTLNHLGIYAICFETTTRAGADTVAIASYQIQNHVGISANFPYKAFDIGAGPTRTNSSPYGACIVFDDGTLGWMEGAWFGPEMNTTAGVNINSGSTPDEYAAVFQVPYTMSIRGGYHQIGGIASTDNFEIILYSDAEGTPAVEEAVAIDPNFTGSASAIGQYNAPFTASHILLPNLWYALALRPTTANNISFNYYNMGATFGSKYKKSGVFGVNAKVSARTNQTGAFTEVQSYFMPIFGLFIDGLDDGVGGSSTPSASVYIG